MGRNGAQRLDAAETFEDRRDAVLFRLMLGTGIRLSSALGLEVEDMAFDAGVIRLRRAKCNREEQAVVPDDVAHMLRTYLSKHSSEALFTNTTGRRLSHRHAQRRFEQVVRKAGITRASPHSLRHTFATELYRRSHDILLVKTALRHRSIVSTLIYARADTERVRDAIA